MTMLSIVTPCYNEQAGIEACYEAVRAIMESDLPELDYEHIFIDNCSPDGTVAKLRRIAAQDPRVRVIVNARNFGPARSPFHAILQARGDAVVPILADLQTPPALIPELVAHWRAGVKSVLAVKRGARDSYLMSRCRSLFYAVMERLSSTPQVRNFIGFGLYDRCVVDAMRSLHEPEPYFRGLVLEVGFEHAVVHYDQPARTSGRSSYNLYSLTDFALLGVSISTRVPLRLMTLMGFVVSLLSLLAGLIYLGAKLAFWYSLPVGAAPILIAIFFLGSVQLFALGVVGEYIGLLLNYTRDFPLVIEKERINFPASQVPARGASGEPSRVEDLEMGSAAESTGGGRS